MKVSEMIIKLQQMNQDAEVVMLDPNYFQGGYKEYIVVDAEEEDDQVIIFEHGFLRFKMVFNLGD